MPGPNAFGMLNGRKLAHFRERCTEGSRSDRRDEIGPRHLDPVTTVAQERDIFTFQAAISKDAPIAVVR